MDEEVFSDVDRYFTERLLEPDAVLSGVLARNAAAQLPAIDVTPTQGKLLYLYARLIGATRILEIGTLGGYSTIWLARAVGRDGTVVTLELEPRHADVARENFAIAGVADRIDLHLGPALDSLETLRAQKAPAFDLVFIDADKVNTLEYFRLSLELCRPGGLIFADNVVRKGQVIDESTEDLNVRGMRRFVDALAGERRVEATAVQTVGAKGYDGFIVARVRD